jgi:NDP-sugar pyrophosphorylase family protein
MLDILKSNRLFDLSQSLAGPFLESIDWPWQAIRRIRELILALGPALPKSDYEQIAEQVWAARSSVIAASASITGPVIIGHEADIRHCAYIREDALVGNQVVVGNSTELKNVILFNGVQLGHFNYAGDSILGYKAHLGAGAITSNVKGDASLVSLHFGDRRIETGLKKMGALLGDFAEIGSNSVLNPGSIVGPRTQVYPLTMVRGYLPGDSILKNTGELVKKT